MKLLTDHPWKTITRAVLQQPGRCRVAVAYFGQGASRLLPLRRGSVLVLDFSEGAVRSGHVWPKDVVVLLRHGVEVYSVTNLHAKVFVAGRNAFVGSTNASRSSAETLVEAVVHDTDPHLMRRCTAFVDGLRGDPVGLEYALQQQKLWKPPLLARGRRSSRAKVSPRHSRTWIVRLSPGERDAMDDDAMVKGKPIARRGLANPRHQQVEDFLWSTGDFVRRVKRGDLVVQVFEERPRRFLVSPPERVLHLETYRVPRGQRTMVFLEKSRAVRRKTLSQLRRQLGRSATVLRPRSPLVLLKDDDVKHRLFQLWPNLS